MCVFPKPFHNAVRICSFESYSFVVECDFSNGTNAKCIWHTFGRWKWEYGSCVSNKHAQYHCWNSATAVSSIPFFKAFFDCVRSLRLPLPIHSLTINYFVSIFFARCYASFARRRGGNRFVVCSIIICFPTIFFSFTHFCVLRHKNSINPTKDVEKNEQNTIKYFNSNHRNTKCRMLIQKHMCFAYIHMFKSFLFNIELLQLYLGLSDDGKSHTERIRKKLNALWMRTLCMGLLVWCSLLIAFCTHLSACLWVCLRFTDWLLDNDRLNPKKYE